MGPLPGTDKVGLLWLQGHAGAPGGLTWSTSIRGMRCSTSQATYSGCSSARARRAGATAGMTVGAGRASSAPRAHLDEPRE